MARTLSERALVSHQASVEDRLRACGAQPWPQVALRRYQNEQERRIVATHIGKFRAGFLSPKALLNTLLFGAIAALFAFYASPSAGAAILGFYVWAKIIYHCGRWPTWQTSTLLKGDLYWRDGAKHRLPQPVQNVVDATRIFFPDAGFAVSFLGHDPVLHVSLNGKRFNALVWDGDGDANGTFEIVAPPSEQSPAGGRNPAAA